MKVHFIHFYPNLMNLYGSYGNVLILKRYLEGLDCQVTVETVEPGQRPDLAQADFLFMGAGTEGSQRAAMEAFAPMGPEIKAAAQDGKVMFFAGTAMELLGAEIREADGSSYRGIGLGEFVTEHGRVRMVGDVYGYTALYPEAVVGFMNKCGRVRGVETPLLTQVALGFGNDGLNCPEGFHWNNIFASQLTGPLLGKNPRLLETVAGAILARRGKKLPARRPAIPWEAAAYAVTEAQLRERLEQVPTRKAS